MGPQLRSAAQRRRGVTVAVGGSGVAVGTIVAVGVAVGGSGVAVAVGVVVAVGRSVGVAVAVGGGAPMRARWARVTIPRGSYSQIPPIPTTSASTTAASQMIQRGRRRGSGEPPSAVGGSTGAL